MGLVGSASDIAGYVGRGVSRAVLSLVDLMIFIGKALYQAVGRGEFKNRATRNALSAQLIFSGVDALPVLTLLALALGLSITSQILTLAEALASRADVTRLLVSIVGLEFGSLITAFLLIGRTGSAIAVDLGNMKLHREVEGLEMLGIDLMDFFVAPRVLGVAVAQMVLAVWFYLVALYGGIVLSGLLLSRTHFAFLTPLAEQFDGGQAVLFLIKNFLFGLIIAGTACSRALAIGASPTEVPQQTQRSIVSSLVLIFLIDGVFALARGGF